MLGEIRVVAYKKEEWEKDEDVENEEDGQEEASAAAASFEILGHHGQVAAEHLRQRGYLIANSVAIIKLCQQSDSVKVLRRTWTLGKLKETVYLELCFGGGKVEEQKAMSISVSDATERRSWGFLEKPKPAEPTLATSRNTGNWCLFRNNSLLSYGIIVML